MHDGMTLDQHLESEAGRLNMDADLVGLLSDVGKACFEISSLVRHGALAGNLAAEVGTNVQDETQKELDVRANEILIEHVDRGGHAIAIASEEEEDPHVFASTQPRAPYYLVFDPLDGSSNIGVNGPVGTIFSALKAKDGGIGAAEEMLQPGTDQLVAGYVLYGTATEMIITLGRGVQKFTMDPKDGQFYQTGASVQIAEHTAEFAINGSNQRHWEAPVQRYISECLAGKEGPRDHDFNTRWVGAMVADVHRCITRSGIFLYPIDEKTRSKGGRLRLLYEANPMSMIIEQAGGVSSTGRGRIMEIQPEGLHQRVPVIMGSKTEVDRLVEYHTNE
ncbi:MAG: class 1 fructose-bisphosphatase [Rhodospirillales bacterium]|nr:class 1 fructose-bisphosphatase [Rhodospirillales bacterium]